MNMRIYRLYLNFTIHDSTLQVSSPPPGGIPGEAHKCEVVIASVVGEGGLNGVDACEALADEFEALGVEEKEATYAVWDTQAAADCAVALQTGQGAIFTMTPRSNAVV